MYVLLALFFVFTNLLGFAHPQLDELEKEFPSPSKNKIVEVTAELNDPRAELMKSALLIWHPPFGGQVLIRKNAFFTPQMLCPYIDFMPPDQKETKECLPGLGSNQRKEPIFMKVIRWVPLFPSWPPLG